MMLPSSVALSLSEGLVEPGVRARASTSGGVVGFGAGPGEHEAVEGGVLGAR